MTALEHTLIGLVAVAVVGLTGLGLLVSYQPLQFWLYSMVLSGVRIRVKEAGSDNRRRILGYIRGHPGAHIASIKNGLDLGSGTVSYHLTVLVRSGFVRAEKEGHLVRLFPTYNEIILAYIRDRIGTEATEDELVRSIQSKLKRSGLRKLVLETAEMREVSSALSDLVDRGQLERVECGGVVSYRLPLDIRLHPARTGK